MLVIMASKMPCHMATQHFSGTPLQMTINVEACTLGKAESASGGVAAFA